MEVNLLNTPNRIIEGQEKRKWCNLRIQLKMFIAYLLFLLKMYHQRVPRLWKTNQGIPARQGSCCHILIRDLEKGPSGKSESPTNEAPGHPLSPPSCEKMGLQFYHGLRVLGINNFHFHPGQERSVILLGEMGATEELSLF